MKREENSYYGILLVNKPQGFTSFDVIAKLRGILKMRKLGHSGTLDPMATGVLPVFAGKATAACDILPIDEKSYTAGFALGAVTDTQDCTGTVVKSFEKKVTAEEVKKAAAALVGDIEQIPPMYSAVQIGGKRLYELAREGKEVERKARKITINAFDILSFDEKTQTGTAFVSCTKGTYIRTLIHDMGQALGAGGYMTSLVRNSSSGFKLGDCLTLEQIGQAVQSGEADRLFIPVDRAFECYDEIKLSEKAVRLYKNGVKLSLSRLGIKSGATLRVYGNGEFLGLAVCDFEKDELVSQKNFYVNN